MYVFVLIFTFGGTQIGECSKLSEREKRNERVKKKKEEERKGKKEEKREENKEEDENTLGKLEWHSRV